MNVLFISLLDIDSAFEHNLYTDLAHEFAINGHKVSIVSPIEKRKNVNTELRTFSYSEWSNDISVLKVRIGNIRNVGLIEKGLSTILIEGQIKKSIAKFYADVKFDLVIYSTPPITLYKPVSFIKKRDNSKTYLLLKDIFPQNAIDLGMMSKSGIKSIIYKYFRKKEKRLYKISDKIGCMSQANVEYIVKHNPEIPLNKVEVCPNAIETFDISITKEERVGLRKKYGIPENRKVFVYGGNLGKPQGIPFVISCLEKCRDDIEVFFLIIGKGTEYHLLEEYITSRSPENVKLLDFMPKNDYNKMIAACDVGLVFLDFSFTIPNFPSRILAYMQAGIPTLTVTDLQSDIGQFVTQNEVGLFTPSNDAEKFKQSIEIIKNKTYNKEMIRKKLKEYFDISIAYNLTKRICETKEF